MLKIKNLIFSPFLNILRVIFGPISEGCQDKPRKCYLIKDFWFKFYFYYLLGIPFFYWLISENMKLKRKISYRVAQGISEYNDIL